MNPTYPRIIEPGSHNQTLHDGGHSGFHGSHGQSFSGSPVSIRILELALQNLSQCPMSWNSSMRFAFTTVWPSDSSISVKTGLWLLPSLEYETSHARIPCPGIWTPTQTRVVEARVSRTIYFFKISRSCHSSSWSGRQRTRTWVILGDSSSRLYATQSCQGPFEFRICTQHSSSKYNPQGLFLCIRSYRLPRVRLNTARKGSMPVLGSRSYCLFP